jgi:hypothetical protein
MIFVKDAKSDVRCNNKTGAIGIHRMILLTILPLDFIV